jgi:hypothetical protein
MGEIVRVALEGKVMPRGDLSVEVISGPTGRHFPFLIHDEPSECHDVQRFAIGLCQRSDAPVWDAILRDDSVAQILEAQIERAAKPGLRGQYYRGRSFPELPVSKDWSPG